MKNILYLLDAYALIYRAYYAFIKNPRINSKGVNTSAIYGFTNTLDEVINRIRPTHLGVVFDPAGPNFRHELYKEYKAQRPPTPEAIKEGIPVIKKIIEGFNIPVIQVAGFEADDVIGTLAHKAAKQGIEVYMMTPDKDYCQLVKENVFMYKPRRGGKDEEILGITEVNERFGIDNPIKVIDILAMWGDASDNIPGIPGVGEVTAKKYIKKFGSLDGLYENTHKLQGKQKENAVNFKEQAYLSYKLATIDTNVPVEFDAESYKMSKPNRTVLLKLFDDLEFKIHAQRIEQSVSKSTNAGTGNLQGTLFDMGELTTNAAELVKKTDDISTVEHSYHLTDTNEKHIALLEQLAASNEFCFDTETTGLNVHLAELVGMSFSLKKGTAYYVPIPANRGEAIAILEKFKAVFENETIGKIGQNIKFDIMMFRAYNIEVKGEFFDTMIAHYLLQPDQRHNMDTLCENYLNYTPVSIEELIGKKGKNQKTMRNVPTDKIKEYASEDADLTLQLKAFFEPKLKEQGFDKLFREMEMPLINVLVEMEHNGIKINTNALNQFGGKLNKEVGEIEKKIIELAGVDFNIASTKQLGEVLFEKMKIVANPKLTKTKQYSTSEPELQKLIGKHEIISLILEYRSIKKLVSTYIEALPKLINPKTSKIHTSFNQAVAATGRLSSNNPNLQNIPIRTENGRKVREAFVPQNDDYMLMSVDYSQIELRVIAHLSKDENMIEAFCNEADIHTATAAKINGVPADEVTKDMRSRAKSANFGIVYGISSFGLAQNLKIKRAEAKQLIDGYFKTYPKVKIFMDESVKLARNNKAVETIMGRKRNLPDIDSRNPIVRGVAERNAINAPVQGSAADIIKIAMINIHRKMKKLNLESKMLLQVHDELVFDVYRPELEQMKEMVKYEMENAIKISVPLTAESGIGENWLEAH